MTSAAWSRWSPRARGARCGTASSAPPSDPVALLTEQVRAGTAEGCALGAFAAGTMVGLAVGLPAAGGWELAVLVCDGWQGRRVGSRLLDGVLAHAASAGVGTVVVVEAANTRALRAVRRRLGSTPSLRIDLH